MLFFRLFPYVLAAFLVSGCFLSQTKPSAPQPQSSPIDGLITLEDVDAAEPSAGIFALFEKGTENSSLLAHVNPRFATLAAAKTAECSVRHKTLNPARGNQAVARGTQLLDAGKVEFGPALQSTLETLSRTEDGAYLKELSPGVGSGLYQFVGDGTREVPRFQDYLSMPEPLVEAHVDDFPLREGSFQLRQKAGVIFRWKAPSVKNEKNLILVEVRTQVENKLDILSCLLEESLLETAATNSLRLQYDVLKQIQHSSLARVDILRAHVGRSTLNSLTVLTQGIRAVSGMGEVLVE